MFANVSQDGMELLVEGHVHFSRLGLVAVKIAHVLMVLPVRLLMESACVLQVSVNERVFQEYDLSN